MTNLGYHPPPTSEEADESNQQTQTEKEVQKEQQKALAEEVPETQMVSFLLQFVGGLGIYYSSKRAKVAEAFGVINNRNFEYNLLKIRDPKKFQQAQRALAIAQKEIKKQKERLEKRGIQRDYAQVGIGPFRRRLGFDEFDRKTQACIVASVAQNRITASEIKIKIRNTGTIYGLDDTHIEQLKKGMAKWLKEKPGRTIDDYLIVQGRALCVEQNGLSEKKLNKAQKKELEGKARQLQEQRKEGTARLEAAKTDRDVIIRAQGEIKERLKPGSKILTKEQLREKILTVLHGPPQPQPPLERLTGGFAEIPPEFADDIMGLSPTIQPQSPSTSQVVPSLATPVTPPPSIQPKETTIEKAVLQTSPIDERKLAGGFAEGLYTDDMFDMKPQQPTTTPAQTVQPHVAQPAQPISSPPISAPVPPAPGVSSPPAPLGISKFFSSGKSLLGGLGKTIGGLGGLGKQALLDGLGALASGGTNLAAKLALKAIDSILKATIGIDAKTAGFIAVGAVALIFIFTTNKIISGAVKLFSRRTFKNPQKAFLDNKIYSWQEFEKKFLAYPKERPYISWQQFEKENLIPTKEYLSKNQSGE